MRIIHLVLGNAELQMISGINKVAHKLATVQTEQGYDVTLWGITKTLSNDYFSRNYKTRLFLKHSSPFEIDPEIYRAVNSLKKGDIVHIHGSFIPAFYQIVSALIESKIPYVYTSHGALSPGAMKHHRWWKLPYFYFFEKKILNNARGVHVLGESVSKNLKDLGVTSPLHLIPNGQELNEVARFDKLQKDYFSIGFCGKIDIYNKGLDIALDGFRKFLKNGGSGKFELIGDGKDYMKLKRMIHRRNIQDHVIFHGSNYGTEKFRLLSQMDVFVRSSRMDGFPVAVLEACSLGIPCIVSEHTNTFDYLKKYKCGFLLKENSAESIKNTLFEASRLRQENQLEAMGSRAQIMVQNIFPWKRISKKLINVYTGRQNNTSRKSAFLRSTSSVV